MPDKTRIKRWLRRLVTFGLLGWVLAHILRRADPGALGRALAHASSGWLLLAGLLSALGVALGVARFAVLLRTAGLGESWPWLLRITLEGRFVGAFTPSTVGLDVYRAIAVGRRSGQPGLASSVVLMEKLLGVSALASLGVALAVLGSGHLDARGVWATVGLGAGCVSGLWLLLHPARLRGISSRLPHLLRAKLDRVLSALERRRPGATPLAAALGLSVAGHLMTAAVFWATARALGLRVPPVELLTIGVALVLSALLPISAGGVGVREGVAVVLLGALGVAAPEATLVATLGWLLSQPPAIVGGVLTLLPEVDAAPTGAGDLLEAPMRALAQVSSPGTVISPPS